MDVDISRALSFLSGQAIEERLLIFSTVTGEVLNFYERGQGQRNESGE